MNQSQQPKRKYTAEFKADGLRLVANGEPIMAVARKMGISDGPIGSIKSLKSKCVFVVDAHKLESGGRLKAVIL